MRLHQSPAWLWSTLAVVAGVCLAAAAAGYQAKSEALKREAQFHRQSDLVVNAVAAKMQSSMQMVRALQAGLSVSPTLDQAHFDTLFEALQAHALPGLKAAVYSPHSQDAQGHDHYITAFMAPLGGNEKMLGFDLITQPHSLAALRKAERLGVPALSAPFTLRQNPPQSRPGFVIRAPVYTATTPRRIRGSLGVSFNIEPLMSSVLTPGMQKAMVLRVVDITASKPVEVYASQPSLRSTAMWRSENLVFGGRVWQVQTAPVFMSGIYWPWLTFVSLSSLGILLGVLLFHLFRAREVAQDRAVEMTRKFKLSEERFRLLNENLPGIVILMDDEGEVSYANRSARQRLGMQEGQHYTLMQALNAPGLFEEIKALNLRIDEAITLPQMEVSPQQGESFWVSLSFSRMDLEGEHYILVLGSDVSEIIEMSEQLEFQSRQLQFHATHDQLTGLYNRQEFENRLNMALMEAKQGVCSAILYIDLDQFKVINDTAGHTVGDRLLIQAAENLRTLVRSEDVLARMGGDEFALLMRDTHTDHARFVAEKIRHFFETFEFSWENARHEVSCSIGGVMVDDADLTQEVLMSRADAACYMAKERGRNRFHLFDEDNESMARRVEMEWVGRIRQAIASNRLQLHYQDIVPIVEDGTQGAHFELLVRMKDEKGAIVAAGEFIPAAERYGLMPRIDRWVLETALDNFDHLHPSGKIATCAINLSGDTIDDPDFEEFLIQKLTENPQRAKRICIEITETSAIRNIDRLVEFIPRLRATGCRLALDDFGAGMASFGYLKNIKVDLIKIDGSFIRDLDHDAMSNSIVSAVTDIAQKMGMEVVAEWVSSYVILSLLQKMGVDYVQGFYLHEPSPCPLPRAP